MILDEISWESWTHQDVVDEVEAFKSEIRRQITNIHDTKARVEAGDFPHPLIELQNVVQESRRAYDRIHNEVLLLTLYLLLEWHPQIPWTISYSVQGSAPARRWYRLVHSRQDFPLTFFLTSNIRSEDAAAFVHSGEYRICVNYRWSDGEPALTDERMEKATWFYSLEESRPEAAGEVSQGALDASRLYAEVDRLLALGLVRGLAPDGSGAEQAEELMRSALAEPNSQEVAIAALIAGSQVSNPGIQNKSIDLLLEDETPVNEALASTLVQRLSLTDRQWESQDKLTFALGDSESSEVALAALVEGAAASDPDVQAASIRLLLDADLSIDDTLASAMVRSLSIDGDIGDKVENWLQNALEEPESEGVVRRALIDHTNFPHGNAQVAARTALALLAAGDSMSADIASALVRGLAFDGATGDRAEERLQKAMADSESKEIVLAALRDSAMNGDAAVKERYDRLLKEPRDPKAAKDRDGDEAEVEE